MLKLHFIISFSVLFSRPSSASAEEIWRCANHLTKSPIYTSAPVRSTVMDCLPSKIDQAPFSVSANITNVYSEPVAIPIAAHTRPSADNGPTPTTKFKATENPVAANSQAIPFVSWKAEEKTKTRTVGVRCAIHGEAASEIGGSGMLLVRRGGAQVDRFPILLKGRFAATRWQIELAGPCRNPEVQLKAP